ncbi:hypothetical protein DIPPA_19526 [Diplonema papillatum]|nr:hypothetical protein DIPPA_19526 [Diplonema papillatum]|eukprot:gene17771-27367_t
MRGGTAVTAAPPLPAPAPVHGAAYTHDENMRRQQIPRAPPGVMGYPIFPGGAAPVQQQQQQQLPLNMYSSTPPSPPSSYGQSTAHHSYAVGQELQLGPPRRSSLYEASNMHTYIDLASSVSSGAKMPLTPVASPNMASSHMPNSGTPDTSPAADRRMSRQSAGEAAFMHMKNELPCVQPPVYMSAPGNSNYYVVDRRAHTVTDHTSGMTGSAQPLSSATHDNHQRHSNSQSKQDSNQRPGSLASQEDGSVRSPRQQAVNSPRAQMVNSPRAQMVHMTPGLFINDDMSAVPSTNFASPEMYYHQVPRNTPALTAASPNRRHSADGAAAMSPILASHQHFHSPRFPPRSPPPPYTEAGAATQHGGSPRFAHVRTPAATELTQQQQQQRHQLLQQATPTLTPVLLPKAGGVFSPTNLPSNPPPSRAAAFFSRNRREGDDEDDDDCGLIGLAADEQQASEQTSIRDSYHDPSAIGPSTVSAVPPQSSRASTQPDLDEPVVVDNPRKAILWACGACRFPFNEPRVKKCGLCSEPKPARCAAAALPPPLAPPPAAAQKARKPRRGRATLYDVSPVSKTAAAAAWDRQRLLLEKRKALIASGPPEDRDSPPARDGQGDGREGPSEAGGAEHSAVDEEEEEEAAPPPPPPFVNDGVPMDFTDSESSFFGSPAAHETLGAQPAFSTDNFVFGDRASFTESEAG